MDKYPPVPIHPFVQAVPDHFDMLSLMLRSLRALQLPYLRPATVFLAPEDVDKWKNHPGYIHSEVMPRSADFHPHAGWERSTMEDLAAMLALSDTGRIGGDDWMMRTDCDVIFVGPKLLEEAATLHPDIELAGRRHDIKTKTKAAPDFAHMSGACMFIRGRTLKRIGALPPKRFGELKAELTEAGLPMVCDVGVSYIVQSVGVKVKQLTDRLCHAPPEEAVIEQKPGYSMVHYGHMTINGVKHGKWQVPGALRAAGLDRW